jgi:hypothetical protein
MNLLIAVDGGSLLLCGVEKRVDDTNDWYDWYDLDVRPLRLGGFRLATTTTAERALSKSMFGYEPHDRIRQFGTRPSQAAATKQYAVNMCAGQALQVGIFVTRHPWPICSRNSRTSGCSIVAN